MNKIFSLKKALPVNRKNIVYVMTFFAIIYVLTLYLLGTYFGFYTSSIKFSAKTVINYIIPLIAFIFITEYIREKILFGELKHKKIIIYVIMVCIDAIIGIKKYDLVYAEDFLFFVGNILCVSLVNNLLFNYVSIRYGKIANILFRIITTIYVYVIPIMPDVHVLIQVFIKLILPYIIYNVLEYIYPTKKTIKIEKNKILKKILNIIIIVIMISLIMLVSCKFKYGILVIGSESMTGTINKTDAIIFEKYNNQKIKNGQILVFESNGRLIVHRVVEIKNVNNEKRYYTKGDANSTNDVGYITENKIFGIYKFRISKIGYLTLMFNDIFER